MIGLLEIIPLTKSYVFVFKGNTCKYLRIVLFILILMKYLGKRIDFWSVSKIEIPKL